MSFWKSKKHGECEIDAEIMAVIPHEDNSNDFTVIFKWNSKKLGWGEYTITFTHDGKIIFDSEYMDSEATNFNFLGALLASIIEKQTEEK